MIDWIKLDPKNLPKKQLMAVTNGYEMWAAEILHYDTIFGVCGSYLDKNGGHELTHYAAIGGLPK